MSVVSAADLARTTADMEARLNRIALGLPLDPLLAADADLAEIEAQLIRAFDAARAEFAAGARDEPAHEVETCAHCGAPLREDEIRYCSRGCARAFESERG